MRSRRAMTTGASRPSSSPGRTRDVVQVESEDGAPLTWTLTGDPATASLESPHVRGLDHDHQALESRRTTPASSTSRSTANPSVAEGPAGDGGTTGPIAVTAGTHTVGESGAGDGSLALRHADRLSHGLRRRCGSGRGRTRSPTQVTVGSGDAIVCDDHEHTQAASGRSRRCSSASSSTRAVRTSPSGATRTPTTTRSRSTSAT